MLALDVSGRAIVTEAGIEILSAPEGITFAPLPTDYDSTLIPHDDKFPMQHLAEWKHGLLVPVPQGVAPDKRLVAQATANGGQPAGPHGRRGARCLRGTRPHSRAGALRSRRTQSHPDALWTHGRRG